MLITIQMIRRLRAIVGPTCILIGLSGFILLGFTDIIPQLHEWALRHVLTAGSLISFAVAGLFLLLFARPRDPKELIE